MVKSYGGSKFKKNSSGIFFQQENIFLKRLFRKSLQKKFTKKIGSRFLSWNYKIIEKLFWPFWRTFYGLSFDGGSETNDDFNGKLLAGKVEIFIFSWRKFDEKSLVKKCKFCWIFVWKRKWFCKIFRKITILGIFKGILGNF